VKSRRILVFISIPILALAAHAAVTPPTSPSTHPTSPPLDLYSTDWLCGQDSVTSECFKSTVNLLEEDPERRELLKMALTQSGAVDLQSIVHPCGPSDHTGGLIEGMYAPAGAADFQAGSNTFVVPVSDLADPAKRSLDVSQWIESLHFPIGSKVRVIDHVDYVWAGYSKAASICISGKDSIEGVADTLTHELTHFVFLDDNVFEGDAEHDLSSFPDSHAYVRFVFTQPGGEADAFIHQFSALVRRDGNTDNVPFVFLQDKFSPQGQFLAKLDDPSVLRSLMEPYENSYIAIYKEKLQERKSLIESVIAQRNSSTQTAAPQDTSSSEVQNSIQRLNAELALVNQKIDLSNKP
jgi:hypothetical protein